MVLQEGGRDAVRLFQRAPMPGISERKGRYLFPTASGALVA